MRNTSPPPDHRHARREFSALLFLLAMLLAWLAMPVFPQPQAYHAFADRRTLWGIPNAVDVLTNAAFVAVGLLGLWRLRAPLDWLGTVARASLLMLFAGMALTGLGSVWYHLRPTDATLVWDRLPMTIGFAGACGAMAAQRISARSGVAALAAMLAIGPASVVYWAATGDLSLYLVVQFGLAAGTLLLVVFAREPGDPLPWWALLVAYVIAKLAEVADNGIWQATDGLLAGHAIKHLAAAAGGLAIADSLRGRKMAQP